MRAQITRGAAPGVRGRPEARATPRRARPRAVAVVSIGLRTMLATSASVAIIAAGCGAASVGPAPADRAAATPAPAPDRAAGPPAPPTCLTIRDQELACDRRCDPIEPVLRTCAAREAHGTIVAHVHWDGAQASTRLELRGDGLAGAAACVTRVLARFVPCLGASRGPQDATLPLVFSSWP